MSEYRVFSALPGALTVVNDGASLSVANAFTGQAGWQIKGARLYVPAALGNPNYFAIAVWDAGSAVDASPLSITIVNSLTPYLGGYVDVLFERPVSIVSSTGKYWIGYISDFDYWSATLGAGAIEDPGLNGLKLVATNIGRGRYNYVNSGISGLSEKWWGVDVLVTDIPAAVPPTTSAGADQGPVEPGAVVTLTPTDTAGSSPITISRWDWVVNNPSVAIVSSGQVATFVAPLVNGTEPLVLRHFVSDGTLTAYDDVAVSVYPASVRVGSLPALLRVATPI